MAKPKDFNYKIEEHVRYNDLDTFGHVNNARYLSYLEEARIGYFEHVLGFDKTTLDFQAVVGTVNIKYIVPVNFGDKLELYTRCSRLGTKSMDLQTLVVKRPVENPELQVLAADSVVTLVSYDEKTKTSAPHNPKTVEKIMAFDNPKQS